MTWCSGLFHTESLSMCMTESFFLQVQASLSRNAQRKIIQRRRKGNMPKEPEDLSNFDDIDVRFQKSIDGEPFLQRVLKTEEGTVLIFVSEKHLQLLSKASVWIMDGTFATAPRCFKQIFTIHGNIGDATERRFIPLVFMLLPKKNESTYTTAFSQLCEIAEDHDVELDPQMILTDFELAEINAAKVVFPSASLHGCFFHFNQSMFRKLKKLGLQRDYGSNKHIELSFKQVVALAFLPAQEVPKAFDKLQKQCPTALKDFFRYFDEFYVHGPAGKKHGRRPKFSPQLWSVYENVLNHLPRTSNNLEGWHTKWNGLLRTENPSIYTVLKQFQHEERNGNVEYLRVLQGEPSLKRRKKVVRKDEQLEKLVRNYDRDPRKEHLDYLTGIALLMINT